MQVLQCLGDVRADLTTIDAIVREYPVLEAADGLGWPILRSVNSNPLYPQIRIPYCRKYVPLISANTYP